MTTTTSARTTPLVRELKNLRTGVNQKALERHRCCRCCRCW